MTGLIKMIMGKSKSSHGDSMVYFMGFTGAAVYFIFNCCQIQIRGSGIPESHGMAGIFSLSGFLKISGMMRKCLIILLLNLLAGIAWSQHADTKTPEHYHGPIIDMHIHAFDENSGFDNFLGKDMSMAMDGITYKAVSSYEELRQTTLSKFEEHNIVKAVVSRGELWYDYSPDNTMKEHCQPIQRWRLISIWQMN